MLGLRGVLVLLFGGLWSKLVIVAEQRGDTMSSTTSTGAGPSIPVINITGDCSLVPTLIQYLYHTTDKPRTYCIGNSASRMGCMTVHGSPFKHHP